jgi:hypothetical protein
MNSRTTRQFWRLHDALPVEVQDQAASAYELWRIDRAHPSLHFKKVNDRLSLWSVRVGRGHRAVGQWRGNTILWIWIGTHADYDKLLKSA